MKYLQFALLLLITIPSLSQERGDSRITFSVSDTTELYSKVKIALAKNDFSIREDGSRDTITTLPRELNKISGYCRIYLVLNGKSITVSGIYGLKRLSSLGYTLTPIGYQPIIFYRGSKAWPVLTKVVKSLQGTDLSYSKSITVK